VHETGSHIVVESYNSHVPPEPQTPVMPHVVAACMVQLSSGSVPAVTGEQVPSICPVNVFVQASQSPVQAELQQTLSTQKLLTHSDATPQGCPLSSLQLPLPSHDWFAAEHGTVALVSSWPAGMSEHIPRLPVTPQDLHVSVHALSQQ
jgi:hypothetical protein